MKKMLDIICPFKEMQTDTPMRYHRFPTQKAKTKKTDNPKCWWDYNEVQPL